MVPFRIGVTRGGARTNGCPGLRHPARRGVLVLACALALAGCARDDLAGRDTDGSEGPGSEPTTVASAVSADGSVEVSAPFALDPLGADRLGFYATLSNHTPRPDTLIAVSSPWAVDGSLHTMVEEGGMMRMHAVPGIVISPQVVVRLEPGSLHGMLEGLLAQPVAGDSIEVTFVFALAGPVTLRMPVRHPADAHHHH